jgi:hypothetical protein
MRKIAVLLAVCFVLTLAGCQSNDSANPSSVAGNNPVGNTLPYYAEVAGNNPVGNTPAPSAAVNEPNIQKPSGSMVEIKENLFLTQLNDIFLNQADYLGKTIKYEGIFTSYTWAEKNMTCYFVYRKSPGCCGADGQAGFEVVWPDDADKTYPKENDWCEVVGTLEQYDEDGQQYLRIALSSLTVKEKRGAEFVNQ